MKAARKAKNDKIAQDAAQSWLEGQLEESMSVLNPMKSFSYEWKIAQSMAESYEEDPNPDQDINPFKWIDDDKVVLAMLGQKCVDVLDTPITNRHGVAIKTAKGEDLTCRIQAQRVVDDAKPQRVRDEP